MKGKVHIKISNIANKITYEFTLNRNITIIEGNSATGKTVLISLIRAAKDKTLQGFIRVDCDYPCIAFSSDEYDWERRIKETENSIIFFDEDATYVKTEEFAKAIQNTSNYYVIVNRESLSNLPYSVDEIYGIKESGKYGGLEPVVNKFYRIYSKYDNFKDNKDIYVDNIITEDKKAGYQFFSKVYDCNCFSSGGNSSIIKPLEEIPDNEDTLIVADGAAFGSQVKTLEEFTRYRNNIKVFLPESFEYLILSAKIFGNHNKMIEKILENPSDYIDSKKFISWERYFTSLVEDISKYYAYASYDKTNLKRFYQEGINKDKIASQIPISRECLKDSIE